MNKELQIRVKRNSNFEFMGNGKIKCLITNHEILPTKENFESYLQSKGYLKALEENFDFTQFEPYIVQHKTDNKKLFCTLTRQVLQKKKTSVLNHVNGKRFKAMLAQQEEEQVEEQAEEEQEEQEEYEEEQQEQEVKQQKNEKQSILKNGIAKKKIQKQKKKRVDK